MVSADWSVVRPATWTADPLYAQGGTGPADTQVPGLAGGRRSLLLFDYGQDVQVFAGRPDRADKSRFTIDFLAGGRTGTVDGRLMDDDSVVLEVRGAPAARHPSLPVRCPAEAPPVGVVR